MHCLEPEPPAYNRKHSVAVHEAVQKAVLTVVQWAVPMVGSLVVHSVDYLVE